MTSSDAGVTSSSIISLIVPSPMPTLSPVPSLTLSPVSTTSGNSNHRPFAGGLLRLSPVLSRRLLAQEIEQQRDDLLRLLLLHPVPGAVEQLTADHAGADLLGAFESARRLVDTPVAHAADEDRWHVDRAPGK